MNSGGDIGQMLGYANAVDDHVLRKVALGRLDARRHQFADHWDSNAEYEAAMVRWPNNRDTYEAMRPGVEWLLSNAATIESECASWQHLLRVDSNRAMDLWINDADPLYVFIRSGDLAMAKFDDLCGEVTQG